MESLEAVSSGSPLLQPEPPDPDIDVMLLVVPPVPPVPPDPPPVLLGCAIIRQISLSFTTPHHQREPEAPLPWFLCASTSFSLKLLCSDAEAGVVELFVARFLGFLIAKCKLTSLHCSSFQVLEDWTSNGEILEFSVKAYPSFEISGTCCWTHLPLLHASARRSLFLDNQEIMLFLNGSLPRIEDVTNLLSFRFKLSVIWTSAFVAMDANVSGLSILGRWFALQHSIFQKRCLVASEVVDVSSTVGYVENFPTCSANGMWIEISALSTKAVTLQKAPRSTASSGLSCLQILSDSIVSLFALRSGLDLIEITGFFIAKNLVPLVTLFSCSSKLSTTLCLVVVFAKGVVPKHCSSSTLF
ncbi:hypothetical protein YC2023_093669 [Brassica napus]